MSIASDIVPLVGENRILAHFGLKNLNREPSKGLLSIIKICGLDKHNITIDDIVFKIGPRINAAGRMRMDENDENASPSGGHAAVELLIEGNESIAAEFGNASTPTTRIASRSTGRSHRKRTTLSSTIPR